MSLDDRLKAQFFHAVRGANLPEMEKFLSAPVLYPDGSTASFDPDIRENGTNETALSIACSTRQMDMIDLLLKYGARPDVQKRDGGAMILHRMAGRGETEAVKKLLAAGADIEAIGGNGTPLMHAIMAGTPEAFKILLAAGANPFFFNAEGTGLLHFAAANDRLEIAQILMDLGVDPRLENKSGVTALQCSASFEMKEKILLGIKKMNGRDQAEIAQAHHAHMEKMAALFPVRRKKSE